jgi:hypothetical protein
MSGLSFSDRDCLFLTSPTEVEQYPPSYLMTETDPVSEMLYLKKSKTMDCVLNRSHVYCYTPSSETFTPKQTCMKFVRFEVVAASSYESTIFGYFTLCSLIYVYRRSCETSENL